MKCIGLCGLHGAGKTYIAHRLHELGGWIILDKRLELQRLYKNGWYRQSIGESLETWYRSVYERLGSAQVMLSVLEAVQIDISSVIIVDAVHTLEEWNVLRERASSTLLVGVWAPQIIRDQRRDESVDMDARRIRFWHNDNGCLLSNAEWAFPGSLPNDLLDRLCRELIIYASQLH